jgi:probable rRNA maturation factor
MGESIQFSDESGMEPAHWTSEGLIQQTSFVLNALHLDPETEVSITFVDSERMAELHLEHMGEPGPTDVMSWRMDDLLPGTFDNPSPAGVLGDVVICPQFAADQAVVAGHGVGEEIELLLTHGLLHLLGHDHVEPEEHQVMFSLQDDLLAAWRESKGA